MYGQPCCVEVNIWLKSGKDNYCRIFLNVSLMSEGSDLKAEELMVNEHSSSVIDTVDSNSA